MKVQVIASGSSGNCYLLTDSQNNTLICEAGKGTFDDALRQIPDVTKIAAVIISHKHNDHYGDAEKWQKAGIKVYGPDQMEHAEQFNIACAGMVPYSVIPLAVEHDPGVLTFSFYIRSNYESKDIYFATDTFSYSRTINLLATPLSLCMVECNHDSDLLFTSNYPTELQNRISKTHTSVKRAATGIQQAKSQRFLFLHASENTLCKDSAMRYFVESFPNREFRWAEPGVCWEF